MKIIQRITRNIPSNITLTVLLTVFSITFSIADHHNEGHIDLKEKDEEFNATEMIMHHISDAYEYHLWGEGHESVSIPLPIILYDLGTGKLSTFLSSEFHHGENTVDGYTLTEHGIVNTSGAHAPRFFDLFSGHVEFLDFSITKNVFSLIFSAIIMFIIFVAVAKSYNKKKKAAPKGMQNLMESLVVYVRDDIAKPNIGNKHEKFMPFLLTIFFFIWINNLIGLVPFFPGGANLTGNIAFTFVLAMATYLVTTFSANKDYWGHIFWMPGVPWPIRLILAPIELVGTLTKPFALMIRLFANITAGHIVVLSLISLIFILKTVWVSPASVFLALFIDILELLVAFLQAFVFTMLSSLFIGAAVAEHEHH